MAVEKVYSLKIEGADSVNDLKEAIEQLNEKLKTLNATSQEYKETLEQLTNLQAKLADAMNGISNSVEKTEKSISGISEKINEMGETISEVSEAFDGLGEIDDSVVDAFVDGIVDGMNEAINSVEDIDEKLDNLDDVDVKINVETDESPIENLSSTLENLEDVDVSVNVDVNDGSIETLTDKLDNIEDAEVKVNVDVNDGQIDTLNETLDSLEDAEVKVDVDVDDNSIDKVTEKLDDIDNTNVSVNVDVNDAPLDNLTTTLDNLEDTTVSVNVDVNEGSLDNLKDTLENVDDVNVSVGVEVDDSSLDNLTTTLEGVEDVTVNVDVEVSDETLDGLSEDISTITADFESLNYEAEKTSETINNIGGASTVKELKQEISDLRDRLVTLDKGSDDYKATVQELIDAQVKLKEVMNAGKNETQAAEGSYNALSQRMSALKQVWKEATDEATRDEIGKQIAEINAELKGMDASIGNFQRNVGNYKSALDGLDGSFVNLKTQLRECKEAMQQLDPASQAYNDAMMRAAEITHQLSEQQEQIKYASTDLGDQLENVRGIATNMAAGFGAVNAAMGLFGQENEEVQQAMLKVQQAMALVQGLQGLDGFIKRTKGLSQAMGLATKATKAQTVATKADAAATKQDAAAKGAEATATASVIPAQLGLNAAMKANPIGFIIGLVASLIAIFSLLKDKIMELIGGNKEMSAAFDKVKAVLAGFGNIIKKSVINPIKMAIIPIKTLAKVMMDLFKGDWSKIGDDIKEGFTEMKDTAIDTINVVGAFKEAYDKKTAEQNEAARKKEAAEREKDLDNQIKDNEAKYGNDWKYTEEAQKLYQEMFKARMEQYAEDSEEYREAQRDKMAYDRDLTEHQKQEDEKRIAASKKAAEDAANARKKVLEDNFKSTEKAYTDYLGKFKNYMDTYTKFILDITDRYQAKFTRYVVSFKDGANTIVRNFSDLKTYLTNSMNFGPKDAEKFVDGLIEALEEESNQVKATIDGKSYMFTMTDQFKETLMEEFGFTEERVEEIFDHISDEMKKADYEILAKESLSRIETLLYNFDRTTKEVMDDVQTQFDMKEMLSGITIPDEATAHTYSVFTAMSASIEYELGEVNKEINGIYDALTKEPDSPFLGKTKEELGTLLPSFRTLLDTSKELNNDLVKLNMDTFKDMSDIWKQDWENRINIVKAGNQAVNDIAEQNFKEQINNAMRWQGVYGNALRDLYEDRDYYQETYDEQKGQLERLLAMYQDMANDERLTFEEKENAKREAAKVTGELIQLEYDKEVNMLKTQKGLIKEWANAFKDAASGIGDILSDISDYYTGLMELEQKKIDKQLEDKEITEEQAHALYEQQRDNFEKSKNLQIAMTWINGFSAAIGAYQSMASIPYVGPVLGAVAAAAALATTAVQANKIKQTTMDNPYGGGSGGGSSSSTSFQLPDVMEYEPQLGRNETNMSDTDELNNDGSGRGRGEKTTRVILVESDVTEAQRKSQKRRVETTF